MWGAELRGGKNSVYPSHFLDIFSARQTLNSSLSETVCSRGGGFGFGRNFFVEKMFSICTAKSREQGWLSRDVRPKFSTDFKAQKGTDLRLDTTSLTYSSLQSLSKRRNILWSQPASGSSLNNREKVAMIVVNPNQESTGENTDARTE